MLLSCFGFGLLDRRFYKAAEELVGAAFLFSWLESESVRVYKIGSHTSSSIAKPKAGAHASTRVQRWVSELCSAPSYLHVALPMYEAVCRFCSATFLIGPKTYDSFVEDMSLLTTILVQKFDIYLDHWFSRYVIVWWLLWSHECTLHTVIFMGNALDQATLSCPVSTFAMVESHPLFGWHLCFIWHFVFVQRFFEDLVQSNPPSLSTCFKMFHCLTVSVSSMSAAGHLNIFKVVRILSSCSIWNDKYLSEVSVCSHFHLAAWWPRGSSTTHVP